MSKIKIEPDRDEVRLAIFWNDWRFGKADVPTLEEILIAAGWDLDELCPSLNSCAVRGWTKWIPVHSDDKASVFFRQTSRLAKLLRANTVSIECRLVEGREIDSTTLDEVPKTCEPTSAIFRSGSRRRPF
jgi:hypothetical protein